jgi:hypothetical protein
VPVEIHRLLILMLKVVTVLILCFHLLLLPEAVVVVE